MLAGAIVGVPAQAGATSSTDVRQPQRAGCIATPSEFDLLQTQHSEYIFDRLARPRDIREFLSEMRRRATNKNAVAGPQAGTAWLFRRVDIFAALPVPPPPV